MCYTVSCQCWEKRATFVTRYVILLLLWYLSNITKYAIKTGNITQVTLLTNVTHYLSNVVTVTSLILRNQTVR